VDAVPHDRGVHRGRHSRRGVRVYPGGPAKSGAAVLNTATRSMIFGGTRRSSATRATPSVQAHGPGFSKILLGDDVVDDWEKYLDLMAESIYINSGRGCINCSGVWASRHTKEIAEGAGRAARADRGQAAGRPEAGLAAFTVPAWPRRVGMIEAT
jgi:hypothetical protein